MVHRRTDGVVAANVPRAWIDAFVVGASFRERAIGVDGAFRMAASGVGISEVSGNALANSGASRSPAD